MKKNIIASAEKAKISGDGYQVGMSLFNTFACIFTAYGLETGLKLIDQALDLALNNQSAHLSVPGIKKLKKSINKEQKI
jgi:hypothetical protein